MPKKERRRVPPPRPEAPKLYTLAVSYPDGEAAEAPYLEAQQLILDHEQLELSVYRLQLRRLGAAIFDWHVAVIGDEPAPTFQEHVRRILSTGEPVTLPAEVEQQLRTRRAQATKQAPWVEGHYQPGRRLKNYVLYVLVALYFPLSRATAFV